MYSTLIDVAELQSEYDENSWVIVDCRFSLKDPQAGFVSYQNSHIPSAIYLNLDSDLSGKTHSRSGRHPLPDNFCERAGSWGIDNAKQVVVYDDNGGAIASRLWWMLRSYGHDKVAVLNGGFDEWCKQQGQLQSGIIHKKPTQFLGELNLQKLVSFTEMQNLYNDNTYCIVDSRDPQRFAGEHEPIDPIAGHIPRAKNYFHQNNVNDEKRFLSKPQLKKQLVEIIGGTPTERVVFYCGSGVTACRNVLIMEYVGLSGAKLFVGSWSEWCRNPELPISTK